MDFKRHIIVGLVTNEIHLFFFFFDGADNSLGNKINSLEPSVKHNI